MQLIHEAAQEFLRVVLLVAAEHRMDDPDAVQNATWDDVTTILAPHLLDQLVVVLGQARLRYRLIPQQVRLDDRPAVQEVPRQRRTVAQRLDRRVHVAGVGNVLQPDQSVPLAMLLKLVLLAATVAGLSPTSTSASSSVHQQLLVGRCRVPAGIARIIANDRRSPQLLLLLLLLDQKHLKLAQVAPDPLRRQVHVDAMRSLLLVVGRTVVVVLLRAANVQTVLLQTYPQVGPVRLALRAWFALQKKREALANFDKRYLVIRDLRVAKLEV